MWAAVGHPVLSMFLNSNINIIINININIIIDL